MTKTDINKSAEHVRDYEIEVLNEFLIATQSYDDLLVTLHNKLPSAITLDAKRMINETRAQLQYRLTVELPASIARYAPPVEPIA